MTDPFLYGIVISVILFRNKTKCNTIGCFSVVYFNVFFINPYEVCKSNQVIFLPMKAISTTKVLIFLLIINTKKITFKFVLKKTIDLLTTKIILINVLEQIFE